MITMRRIVRASRTDLDCCTCERQFTILVRSVSYFLTNDSIDTANGRHRRRSTSGVARFIQPMHDPAVCVGGGRGRMNQRYGGMNQCPHAGSGEMVLDGGLWVNRAAARPM
jgi:hypothetical protein